jgi:4-hydroxy-3-polyprenylbenzoate decarboxylase
MPPETDRDWGRVLAMSPDVISPVDALLGSLGIGPMPDRKGR